MRERRYAPLGVTADLDNRITTLEGSTYLQNVVEDTSPQLGGPLDMNGQYVSTSLQVRNTAPKFSWYETDAVADGKLWDIVAESQILRFRSRTDADGSGTDWMQVTRSGNTVTGIEFGGSSTLGVNVNDYVDLDDSRSVAGIRLRTAGTQRGYLYADSSGIGILSDSGSWSIRHNHSDDSVTIAGDLNLSSGKVLNIAGSSTDGIGGITGQYGAIQTRGSTGGYGGISLDGNFVLMNSGSAHVGLYNDINNEWMMLAYPNSYVQLYYNGVASIRTQQYNATGNTSSATAWDHDNVERDVGFNTMDVQHQNASYTLDASDCGTVGYHNNTTAYTVTLEASTSTDFPLYGVHTYINHTDTTVTFAQGSGTTLIWQHGSTGAQTGNRTMSARGVANIWRYATNAYFIWGIGLA